MRTERAAGRVRLTQRHVLSGPAGSRVIEPLCVDDALCSDALYVDLGPATPPAGMQDIVEPSPPPAPWPWGTIAAFTAVSGIAIGAWRRWRRPVVAAPATGPDDPAHVVALRRWEALRADPSLAASLHIPARSLSTSEVLRALGGRAALRDGHLQGAERLLRATDRIKYAEDRPGADKFGIFDEDLRAFIGATRPVVEAGR